MNEHNIVNGIFAAIAIVVFVVRLARKIGAGAAPKAEEIRRQMAEAKTQSEAPRAAKQQQLARPGPPQPGNADVRGSLMKRIAAAMPSAIEGLQQAPKLAPGRPGQQPAKAATLRQPARTAAPQQAVAMYQEAARPAAPARPPVPRAPDFGFPAEAAAAFPVLDLTLPGDAPDELAPVRTRRRAPRGGLLGSAAWSANAIVALEVLGPPVSLRSGATLGAPHAF